MRTVLLPVDGSKESLRAVGHVAKLAGQTVELEVHLLNVQSPLPGGIALFVPEANIDDYYREQGERELSAAEDLLSIAGIDYTAHLAIGPVAETIERYAEERKVDEIVVGARGLGMFSGLLLGSTTTKVMSLARVPVTVVK